jgi:hypothetical protein
MKRKITRFLAAWAALSVIVSIPIGKLLKRNRINSYGDLVPWNDPSR